VTKRLIFLTLVCLSVHLALSNADDYDYAQPAEVEAQNEEVEAVAEPVYEGVEAVAEPEDSEKKESSGEKKESSGETNGNSYDAAMSCCEMFKANETDCLENIPSGYESCQYSCSEADCSWKCECTQTVTEDYPAPDDNQAQEGQAQEGQAQEEQAPEEEEEDESSESASREQVKCRKGKKKLGFKNPRVAMEGLIEWKNEDRKFKKKCCF
jgi:hypothetical protein